MVRTVDVETAAVGAQSAPNRTILADAMRYRYLREHRSYHYGMSVAEPSPAEWGIAWGYQQSKPGEQFQTIDSLIDAEIALLDEEDRALLASVE